jgi:hypothetical protein
MGSQPIGRTKCVTGHSFFIIRSQWGNRCVGVPCPRCPLSVLVISIPVQFRERDRDGVKVSGRVGRLGQHAIGRGFDGGLAAHL